MSKNKYTLITLISLMLVTLVFGQWDPSVRLTNDPNTSFLIYNNAWSVASSGSNVHVIWRDTRDGNYEVYYKRSLDNGTTWGPDTRITTDLAYSKNPCIAVSDTNVHVAWTDSRDGNDEIYYMHSLDNGSTWSTGTRLTNNSCTSLYPSLAVSDTNVHVVWHEDRGGSNYEIYYRHSYDNGFTWSSDTNLSNAAGWSGMPSIAVSDSIVHVFWRDQRDGNNEIYYVRSLDNGLTWSADTNLTNNSSTSENACIAVSGSNVHLTFYDNREGNHEIYYKRSLDNGSNWGADTRLTDYLLTSTRPSVAVYDTNIHIGWFEYRDDNEEIYYKRSLDNGTTWSADTNLSNDTAYSGLPSIAVSGSNVHVVWMDDRDGGDYEIYYKRYLGTTTTSYTITATTTTGGSITPSGAVIVPEGSDTTFIITPDANHHLDSLIVDGENHGQDSTSYKFEGVTSDHTIDAYFSINTFTILATTTSGGTITPSGDVIVEYGADTTFTISANTDYQLDSLIVDGINHGPDSISYTFEDVDADHTIHAMFSMTALPGWTQKESLPPLVKDGGALVGVTGSKDGDLLFAFRGAKSKEFYMYDGTWTAKETIPFGYKYPLTEPPAINKKFPGKGTALCFDGDHTIYATKGNGTWEFWAYDINANTWTAKAFIPSLQKIKGGTSMAYYEGKVYLLAGAQKKDNLNNFFAYDPTQDTALGLPWTTLTGAPITPPVTAKPKPFKDGSALSVIGNTIYAIKGGDKYNFFYAYDIATDIWTEMETIPLAYPTSMITKPKKNKVGDGAAMTTDGSILYVIKGKGKQDFWSYNPISEGVWTPLDTIPILHKKSVPKTGAGLAYANSRVWLLKGNKTPELWSYIPEAKSKVKTQNSKLIQNVNAQSPIPNPKSQIDVTPNPFTKLTTIRYTVPISGKVSLKLYNATGRLIEILNDGYLSSGIYSMNLSGIVKGIYFLKYQSNTNMSVMRSANERSEVVLKLIVE